jgi:hypothetical protein
VLRRYRGLPRHVFTFDVRRKRRELPKWIFVHHRVQHQSAILYFSLDELFGITHPAEGVASNEIAVALALLKR